MPDGAPATSTNGHRSAPDEVWAQVRQDYLAGISAPECCRRHGVGLTALRKRAAGEGWRRADQPWTPPVRLDPWDEGVLLEDRVAGDLDKVELHELEWIADRRMMRAVLRGDAVEALRWRRVRAVIESDARELARRIHADEVLRCAFEESGPPREAHDVNDVNGVNDVSGPGA
ncbi:MULTISPECIES: hypothetical protein [unclassified Brevundimonas]|uniref:hypothetical protein n=1 Tax=unclassified Brevundimonas TaxID=2622653 RepID=UPI0007010CEB|nr:MULTISPECIES: hypothetical protein [unclassified Brevundimonas]KQY88075.1 hypothetical protein ASD25_21150 [Brevundimonas sp. Root1423]KRA28627.1 hypothetical protein ASD59_02020 [Brevundimonas sp. Root608]